MVVPAVGFLLAFFVLPPRWGIALLVAVVIWEVAEKLFWLRLIRRYPVAVGRETLIGHAGDRHDASAGPTGAFACRARAGARGAAPARGRVTRSSSRAST